MARHEVSGEKTRACSGARSMLRQRPGGFFYHCPMRPLLKLKKSLDAPALPVAKAPAPAEPAPPAAQSQPAKPAQPARRALEKAQLRLENIRLGEQAAARRRAAMARVAPLASAYLRGKPALTTPDVLEGELCWRPLCVGVDKAILAWLRAQPEVLDCSTSVLKDAIDLVLAPHVAQPQYLAGILKLDERVDLEGRAVGLVSAKEKARAVRKLATCE